MPFYEVLKNTASFLLKKYGTSCVLYHKESDNVVEYKGVGAKFKYESEAIGMSGNTIKAGDAKVICQFPVTPIETVDIIKIGVESFSIISMMETSPDNNSKIIYTLQVRKRG